MKIIILGGHLSSVNRGVNALTMGTIKCIRRKYENATITLLINGKSAEFNCRDISVENIRTRLLYLTYFLSVVYRLYPFLRKILMEKVRVFKIFKNSIIIDLSAGDSFTDLYGIRRVITYSLNKLIPINLGNKVVIFPQTIGPFDTLIGKYFAKRVLCEVNEIAVREPVSRERVFEILKRDNKIFDAVDMAFLMEPQKPIQSINFPQSFIGINISGLLYNKKSSYKLFRKNIDYENLIIEVILMLLHKTEVPIVLIPHTYCWDNPILPDDLVAARKVHHRVCINNSERVHILDGNFSAEELKYVIGKSEFFIGSRMHSCIAALSMRVPTVSISYSYKFSGIMTTLNQENNVCDPKVHDNKEILSKILHGYKNRKNIRKYLEKIIPLVESKAYKCQDLI